jgi:hypothetical protein
MVFPKILLKRLLKRQSNSLTLSLLGWRMALAGVLCLWTLLSVACHKQSSTTAGVTIKTEISPRPAKAGPIIVTLDLSDHAGKPLAGAHINLEGDMSHAGMAPVFGDAKETAPGRYQGNLQLTMGGDWVVLSHITLANGQTLERQIDLSGVQSD